MEGVRGYGFPRDRVNSAEVVMHEVRLTAAARISIFRENALVSRVKRPMLIRIVRLSLFMTHVLDRSSIGVR